MPTIIGVAGDSGTGKSNFIKTLSGELKAVSHISLDDYHIYDRETREKMDITPLNPKATDMELMHRHIKLAKQGKKFMKNSYDHRTGKIIEDAETFSPKKVVVFEGLLPFYERRTRELFDITIFFDVSESIKREWKVKRDIGSRGYTKYSRFFDLQKRKIDFKRYVATQAKIADILVDVEFSRTKKGEYITRALYRRFVPCVGKANFEYSQSFKIDGNVSKGKNSFTRAQEIIARQIRCSI